MFVESESLKKIVKDSGVTKKFRTAYFRKLKSLGPQSEEDKRGLGQSRPEETPLDEPLDFIAVTSPIPKAANRNGVVTGSTSLPVNEGTE